jgi:hypothetical protein
MIETDDLACAGLKRVGDDDWRFRSIEREVDPDADKHALAAFAASSAPPKRRERKPNLENIVKQLLKAGQAVGVPIAVTIEGATVTASPSAHGMAPANRDDRAPHEAPARRSLFTTRSVPKQKVVL